MNDHDAATEDCSPIPYSEAAVIRLEAECGRKLEAYVRRRLNDNADPITVVERCWVDLTKKWKRQGQLTQPRALLFRLAQYRVIDWIRHTSRRPESLEADQHALDDVAAALRVGPDLASAVVVRVDVRAALAELPIRQREALLLTCGYGLSYEDTASIMACPTHTVNNLLRAGKASLRKSPHLTSYGIAAPSSPPEVNK